MTLIACTTLGWAFGLVGGLAMAHDRNGVVWVLTVTLMAFTFLMVRAS